MQISPTGQWLCVNTHCVLLTVGLLVSPVRAVVQTVVESLAEHRVLIINTPGGLKHRVEEAVPGCTVPKCIQPTVQSAPELQGPVDNWRLFLEF